MTNRQKAILAAEELTGDRLRMAKRILIHLVELSGDKMQCDTRIPDIAKDVGVSINAVNKSIRTLKDNGLLSVVRNHKKPGTYRLTY